MHAPLTGLETLSGKMDYACIQSSTKMSLGHTCCKDLEADAVVSSSAWLCLTRFSKACDGCTRIHRGHVLSVTIPGSSGLHGLQGLSRSSKDAQSLPQSDSTPTRAMTGVTGYLRCRV